MALGFERAVAKILEDAVPSLGTYGAAVTDDIHIGESLATPRDAREIAIVMEAGGGPINGREPIGMDLGFTVQVRSPTYEDAVEHSWKIHEVLNTYQGVVRDVRIARITPNFPPQPLGRDDSKDGGMWRVSQSFTAITRVVPFT